MDSKYTYLCLPDQQCIDEAVNSQLQESFLDDSATERREEGVWGHVIVLHNYACPKFILPENYNMVGVYNLYSW